MSEHAWALENVAAHVAGGLGAAEAERLERHAAGCPECAAALRRARALDGGLSALFAADRPRPALEDRLIGALRSEELRRALRRRRRRNLAWGAAAAVALGLSGAGMSRLVGDDALPFPGAMRVSRAPAGVDHLVQNRSPREANNAAGDLLGSDWGGPAPVDAVARDDTLSMNDPEVPLNYNVERLANVSVSQISDGTSNITSFRTVIDANGTYSKLTKDSGLRAMGPALRSAKDNKEHHLTTDEKVKTETDGVPKQNPPPLALNYFKPGDLLQKSDKPKDGEPKPKEEAPPARPAPDKPEEPKPAGPPAPEPAPARKVIRSGDVEFEVESFDSAVATVTKLVAGIKGGFIATINSDKLANGKVKGAVVVRVPPDALDALVLDLRKELGKGGELKGLRIGSQDVTKQYTDLESRLKAARTMEQRLLQIIKEGKGEIKALLEAEKELGVWRTKIEESEGEIRYYANQVALSTLTISLAEKDIRAAADLVESERVQVGIEVEDVDKAQREALAAVAEAKGRVTRSELKQHAAGQFSAVLQFEVAPEAAGPLRDRLRQLGNMVRLDIDRVQLAEGGSGPPGQRAKVRRGDTRFDVSFYNLANVAPRESAVVQLAVADVPAGYQALKDAVGRAKGRVITAKLDEQDRQNVTAQLDFEVRRGDDEAALRAALDAAGEVLSRNVSRAAEGENITDAKVLYRVSLVSAANVRPREVVTLGVEVADVEAARDVRAAQVAEAKGRTVEATVAHERSGRVSARLVYDVPLSAAAALVERFKGAGTVRVQQTTRNPQAPEGRLATARLDVTLSNAELIVPRDDGLWPQVRKGLSYSLTFLSWSLTWLIFGLCVVLPWAVVGYGGYRLARRLFRAAPAAPTAPPPA